MIFLKIGSRLFNEKELFSFTIELKFIGKKLSKSLCRIMEKEKLAHFLANNQNFSMFRMSKY
jgi:hypothetical protein